MGLSDCYYGGCGGNGGGSQETVTKRNILQHPRRGNHLTAHMAGALAGLFTFQGAALARPIDALQETG